MYVLQPVTPICIMTFQKAIIDLKSSQRTMNKFPCLDVNHSIHTGKCSFSL